MPEYADYLPPRARCVVEFGCGAGEAGRRFKQIQPACRYIGVDTDEEKLKLAAVSLDQTAQQEFSSFDLAEHGIHAVDCLVYHDCFLQRSALQKCLQAHISKMREEGQVVFLLDNPGYFRRIATLWQGHTVPDCLQLALPDLVNLLKQCGLTLHRVIPQYVAADKELRESNDVQRLVQLWEKLQGRSTGDI